MRHLLSLCRGERRRTRREGERAIERYGARRAAELLAFKQRLGAAFIECVASATYRLVIRQPPATCVHQSTSGVDVGSHAEPRVETMASSPGRGARTEEVCKQGFRESEATSQFVPLFALQKRVYAAATPLHLAPVLYLIAIALSNEVPCLSC